nr:tyrosine recombinase XerD-like [Nerophis lumbriciformis]
MTEPVKNELVAGGRGDLVAIAAPALIERAGPKARKRFFEFFTANIRNPNTRRAYAADVGRFLAWCDERGLLLEELQPMVVAAYIEELTALRAPSTVKRHLAAIRMLCDWLVVGQVLQSNPAAAVRGPKHVVREGKTPILFPDDVRRLFASIDTSGLVGLRDRAILGVMLYSFARVGAVVKMNVGDYYTQGRRAWFNLHEKGGRFNRVPAHHTAAEYVDEFLAAAPHSAPKTPLFTSAVGRTGVLTENRLGTGDVLRMVKRRSTAAGLPRDICNHSCRGSGITAYLANGGDLTTAARIAGHASTRTTQLYDRTKQAVSLAEIERIRF